MLRPAEELRIENGNQRDENFYDFSPRWATAFMQHFGGWVSVLSLLNGFFLAQNLMTRFRRLFRKRAKTALSQSIAARRHARPIFPPKTPLFWNPVAAPSSISPKMNLFGPVFNDQAPIFGLIWRKTETIHSTFVLIQPKSWTWTQIGKANSKIRSKLDSLWDHFTTILPFFGVRKWVAWQGWGVFTQK
jgi:hypothetical protein